MKRAIDWWTRLAAVTIMILSSSAVSGQTPGPVSASSWSGLPGTHQTITFAASFPESPYPYQAEVDVAINTQNTGIHGCFFSVFWQPGSTAILRLFDDAAANWYPVRLGSTDTQSNSHCQIFGANSSATYASGTLSISVDVIFSNSWAGCLLHFFEQAVDPGAYTASGWWELTPSSCDNSPCGFASFSVIGPNLGSPQQGTYTFANGTSTGSADVGVAVPVKVTASDPNGWAVIDRMSVVLSTTGSGTGGCFFVLFPYLNEVFLWDDTVTYWTGATLGSLDSVWNSSCSLSGGNASYMGTGTIATLSLSPTFWTAGTNYFYEAATDQLGNTTPGWAGWSTVPGSLTVASRLVINISQLPSGAVGQPYSQSLNVYTTGGTAPYHWTATGLPAGLSLSDSGILSGTPTAGFGATVSLSVIDSVGGIAAGLLFLKINVPPTITTTSLPAAVAGTNYSTSLTASGGTPPYTWSVAPGSALPPWLSLGFGNAKLSGMPVVGTYSFSVQVTDSAQATNTMSYSLTVVNPTDFTMSGPSPTSVTVTPTGAQASYNQTFQGVNGFSGSVKLSYSGGGGLTFLPASVVVSGSTAIVQPITVIAPAGTVAQTYSVQITATGTDVSGTKTHTSSSPISVTVTAPPAFTIGGVSPAQVVAASNLTWNTFSIPINGTNGYHSTVNIGPGPFQYHDQFGPPHLTSSTSPGPAYIQFSTSSWPVDAASGSVIATGAATASSNSAPPGLYYYDFQVSDGVTLSTLTLPVNVTTTGQSSDFSLSPSVNTVTITSGGPPYIFTEAVTSTSSFNQPVGFSPTGYSPAGWPSGVTVAITPSTIPAPTNGTATNGAATISIQAAKGTASGSTTAYITASGGGKTHMIPVTLNVNTNATFSLSASPGSQTANNSGSATYQIGVTGANNFADTVGFKVSGLPTGSTSFFDPPSITGTGTTLLTVTVPPVLVQTTYTLIVTGTSGSGGTSVVVPLIVPASSAGPATMSYPSPGLPGQPGQTITSRTVNFSWTPGTAASLYQLVVATSQYGSDVATITTTAQSASVQFTGTPTNLYATLSSLAGIWQSVPQYKYPVNLNWHSQGPSTMPLAIVSTALWNILDDNNANVFPDRSLQPSGSSDDCSTLTSCQVQFLGTNINGVMNVDPNTTVTLGNFRTAHDQTPPLCDVTVTATYSANPGKRSISCYKPDDISVPSVPVCPGVALCAAGSAVLQINAATPSISHIDQPNPIYTGGDAQYITIWGTNFGPNIGIVSYCVTGEVLLFGCGKGGGGSADSGLKLDVTFWGPLQINVKVSALAGACTTPCTYDIVVQRSDGADIANQPNSGRVKGITVSKATMDSLQVTQVATANAVDNSVPNVTPLTCKNTNSAFATDGSVPATPCNGFVVILKDSGTVSVTGGAVQPAASASLVRWSPLKRDGSDTVATGDLQVSPGTGTQVTFQPSAAGNFRLVAYIDANSNGVFDEGEQLQVLQVAIVQVTLQPSVDEFTITSTVLPDTSTLPGLTGAKTNPGDTTTTASMKIRATYLLQGGGAKQLIGTSAISLGDTGNLISDSFMVSYPGATPGTEIENPGGVLPMIDSFNNPVGGDSVFRDGSGTQPDFNGPPDVGTTLLLKSSDSPKYAWNQIHPHTQNLWGSTSGGNSFREFILAFSASFPQTYVAISQADWHTIVLGTNSSPNATIGTQTNVWADQGGSAVQGDSTLQQVPPGSKFQVIGPAFRPSNSMIPRP